MIVVAGIGDQSFVESDAFSRDAAVYPRNILRPSTRDIAEWTAGLDLFVLPSHTAKPQLGSPLIVRPILGTNKGGANRAASEQGFEFEGCATRVRGVGAKAARNRKRYRRVNQIVDHELQQVGVTGRNAGVSPT